MMPEMDGFEVCSWLKSDRNTSHIPIILLTAKAPRKDKLLGLERGADAYLTKPFNKEELFLRLDNLNKISQKLKERLNAFGGSNDHLHKQEKKEATFLLELQNTIEANLADEMFNTQQLCRAMAMSRTQLYRKLKALTGQSTANYIRSVGLKKSKITSRNNRPSHWRNCHECGIQGLFPLQQMLYQRVWYHTLTDQKIDHCYILKCFAVAVKSSSQTIRIIDRHRCWKKQLLEKQ